MNDKIQAALQAYQKKKSRAGLSASVSSALDSYETNKRRSANDTTASLAERINEEINVLKSVSDPEWGADSLRNTLTNTNESRIKLSKLQNELTANKNYMDNKTYNNLATTLKQMRDAYDSYIKSAEARSHFASEDAYNSWLDEYQREENERNAVLNAEDFKEYTEIGKNVENPSWDAARAPFVIAGWKPFGEGATINNMVTFAESNSAEATAELLQAIRAGGSTEHAGLVRLINEYMKPEEKSIYNYYIGKGDYEKANEYLTKLTDKFRQREADELVAQADNNATELLFSIVAGLDQFRAGVANIDNLIMGTEADPTSSIQYAQSTMSQNNDGVWKFANDLATTTANMLPSIAVGTVTGGVGGALTMGTSAAGNAYSEMLREGYSPDEARWYGVLTGASETVLSSLLSGVSSLGGKLTGKSIDTLAKGIKNTSLRLAAQIPLKMASEGFEEGLQEVIEPVIKSIATGETFTAAQVEDVLYSALLGAVSSGLIEGAPSAIRTGLSNKVASDRYGANSKQLVDEAMGVQNNAELRKLAEKYQARVNSGKQLTGGQINGLIDTMDSAKLKTSILQRLGELGETGEVSAIADVLMKFAQGEKLSAADLTTLDNSKAGYMVMTEMDRQNIESGGLGAENRWAENIGTRRVNPEIYNKNAYDSAQRAIQARKEAEKASVGNTMTEAEKSAEGKYKVSESGRTMISATGAEVEVKRIVSTDGGKVKVMLDNGKTANASDLSYATAEEGIMYEMVARLGASPNSANVIMNAFKPKDANEARQYLSSVPLAYGYGKIGNKAGLANINLPESAKQMLYERGRADAKATAEVKAKSTSTVVKKSQKTAHDKNIIFEGFEYNEDNLNDLQKASMPAIEFISGYSSLEMHVFASEIVDGKRVATIDGKRVSAPNGYFRRGNEIWLDINAGNLGEGAMLYTMSHEITHYIRQWSPNGFKDLADFLIAEYNKNHVPINDLIEDQKTKIKNRLNAEKKAIPDPAKLFDMAYEEMVCDAMSQMLADPKAYEKLAKIKQRKPGLWKKIGEAIKALLDKIKSSLGIYNKNATPDALEAVFTNELTAEAYEKLQNLYLKAFVEADANYEVSKSNGFTEKYLATKDISYNLRATESHKEKLAEQYSTDATVDLDTLTQRYDKIISIWKSLGGELNSKFLTEWNNKVGKDRAFTVFKAQAGYKYNVELSSMCKKGVPLFEAIDTIVKQEVMKELNTEVLGKEEKEILYDLLKSRDFEIPCAICYVEQARQREGVIIDAFLNGKVEKNGAGKVTTFKLGWNEVLKEVEKEMKALGVDYTLASVDRNIATDKYVPADITMDEATQNAFYKALKKIANKEIARYNKAEGKSRKLVTDVTPSAIKSVFGGTLPSNLKIFKVLFTEPSSRLILESDLLYSSMTTHNLATAHNNLYSLFNSQGGVSGYKTKQGTVVYWGDILNKTWSPSKVRDEGGIRNQSNSDFQIYTLLDQAQMYIDFTAKGYYLQAYTKVLSELKLFGLSRGKINASLIPAVYEYRNADGSVDIETTRANAGLDKNGNLLFDDIEGINHKEAFMLLEDADYSKSIGGICIGYSDAHILKLLDDNRVQQIIGFHDKTDDPNKRYRGARYAKNYNGLNEAVNNKDGKTVHLGFNPYVRKAEKKFTFNAKTETYEGTIVYNGKTYVADDIPKLAADMYLEMCREKNYTPAYTDFDFHENYYKLLADFSLYDSQGHYAPHRKVAYNMPDSVPYLDINGKKQYMPTKDYIKAELEKELKVRDAISEALADKSENGLIPQFVKRVNESKGETKFSGRDSEGNVLSKAQQEFFAESKARDEDGNLLVLYHGTSIENRITEFLTTEGQRTGLWMSTDHKTAVNFSTKDAKLFTKENSAADLGGKGVYLLYANVKKPLIVDAQGKRYWQIPRPSVMGKGDVVSGEEISNFAFEHGYDGVIINDVIEGSGRLGTDVIVYSHNQVKYADNLNPTEGNDISYSDRDSLGNELSLEQQEYFKDSKVRDKKGNLIVLYHGTTANFNTFKKGDVGFHFGTKGAARGRVGFGKNVILKEVYLNITNPIVFDEDLGSWDADWRLTRELYDMGILTQAEAESVLLTDNRMYKRTTEAANKKLASVLLDKGYDGIQYSNTFETKKATTSYIVFNSNQAKEITNKTPTSNPDIRYSDRTSYAPTFYSHMGKVVDGIRLDKMGAGGVVSYLKGKGVKDEEIKWSGIETFLEGKKSVTKAELQEFVAGSQLVIEEENSADTDTGIKLIPDSKTGDLLLSMDITDSMTDSVLYEGQAMYSERDLNAVSNRSLLANALESVTENEIEKDKLDKYKSKIALIEAEQARLTELNAEANKIRFTKGRTKSDTERMRKLDAEANTIANRIKTYDKQLLNLESTTALKNVLEREKKQLRKRLMQRGREALAEQRQRDAETVKELMAMHQESRKKAIENRNKTALRNKIRDFKAKLQRNLQHPTDRVYIPSGLASAIIDICNLIDTDQPLIKSDGTPNKAQEYREKKKAKLLALKAEYDKLQSDPDPLIATEYEEAVSNYLAQFEEKYANKSLTSMSLEELQQMYEVLKSIDETLRDARKTIGWAEAEDIYEAGDAIAKEQADLAKERKRDKRGALAKANDWVVDYTLSPVRSVERMAGYHEGSYLTKMFREFEKGVRVKNLFVMRAYKLFEGLTQGKNFEDAVYKKHGNTYVDAKGREFRVSKMQMMQSILSYEREVANDMIHISKGGFTFADLALLNKGNLREAISAENAHSVNAAVAAKMLAEFSMALADDQWAQDYMKASREFFDGMAKEAVNDTYLKLKHRIIARDSKYIPFETDKNFVVREISARNDIQQTINSYGMLQDIKEGASQPLIISGLNNILDRHIEQVGSIKGLAVPVRDFNKIWNVRTQSGIANDPTVKGAIEQYRGTGAVKLITDAVQDIQGARPNNQSWLYRKIKSGYITAKFVLNLSVVLKQIGSIFTANSMLKWRNPASVLGNLVYTMTHAKEISAEVDQYTASVWMRRQGLSDSELHTLATEAKKPGVLKLASKLPTAVNPTKWITGMDTMVALSLWKYAKEDTAARTGLEGEELLKATAEFFDSVIENTQSVSDVLHRPEVQKRSDIFSEALGMFKTDLYQTAGQLRVNLGKFLANKNKENAATLGRTVYGIIASTLWSGALVQSLVAMLRYKVDPYRDDEDKDLSLESWLQRLGYGLAGELGGYAFPLAGGELVDMLESVMYGETTDDAVDSLVITAINDLVSTTLSIASKLTKREVPSASDLKKILVKALEVFGLPANNIARTIKALGLHTQDIANNEFLSFEAGVDRTAEEHINRFTKAFESGDSAKAGALFGEAVETVDDDRNEAISKLKTALGKKYKSGKISRDSVEKILQTYFEMDEDEVYWKLDEWDYKAEHGADADYLKYQDFYDAVSTGKNLKAVIKEYTANGVEKNTLASQITSHFKPIYTTATKAERTRLKGYLLNAYATLGYDRKQKSRDIDAWLKS